MEVPDDQSISLKSTVRGVHAERHLLFTTQGVKLSVSLVPVDVVV